jgi:hypothetical protein
VVHHGPWFLLTCEHLTALQSSSLFLSHFAYHFNYHSTFNSHQTTLIKPHLKMAEHNYKFNITMTCGGCSGAVERVLKKLDGKLPGCAVAHTHANVYLRRQELRRLP